MQTAYIVRELGGKTYAFLLTAVTILVAPQYLSNGSLLTTNCLEPNLWMACAYFVILAIKRNQPKYWLWVGVFAGIGLEEKYSIAFFVTGIVVGLLLTEQRRTLMNRWIWLGGLAAFLIFLPNLLWNIHYRWPFLELMHNIRAEGRDVILPAGQYFFQQTLLIHPLTAPIWITGLLAFLLLSRLKAYRVLGIGYLVCYSIFFALHGKNYYLAPIYPMLLASGAVVFESALGRPRLVAETGYCCCPAGERRPSGSDGGSGSSPDGFISYMRYLPVKPPVMEHAHARAVFRSGTPTSSDGMKSSRRLPWPGSSSRRTNAATVGFLLRITVRREPLISWPPVWLTAVTQWSSDVVDLGTARLLWQLPDRS